MMGIPTRKYRFATAAAAVLLVAFIWPFGGAPASSASVADSSLTAHSYDIASGVLLSAGVPIKDGTAVAFAWPNQAHLRDERQGERYHLHLLGVARTDRAGRFAIRVNPSQVPARFRSNGGINVTMFVVAHGRYMQSAFPAKYVRSTAGGPQEYRWVSPGSDITSRRSAVMRRFDLLRHTTAPTYISRTRQGYTRGLTRLSDATHASVFRETPAFYSMLRSLKAGGRYSSSDVIANAASPSSVGLDETPLRPYWNQPENFVDTYTTKDYPETVLESYSSVHTLGLGASLHVDGPFHVETDLTAQVAKSSGSNHTVHTTYASSEQIYNSVNYEKYRVESSSLRSRGDRGVIDYYMKPLSFGDFLTKQTSINYPDFKYCLPAMKSTGWETDNETNATYGGGVTLSGAYLGVSLHLSAQSGYSNKLSLTYKFKADGYMCGTTKAGPIQSPVVEASATDH